MKPKPREELPEAEAAAVEYLDALARGEEPDRERCAAKLTTKDARAEFDEILRFAVNPESYPQQHLGVGARLGPYRIEAKIGEGGMGVVYRAKDERLGRVVAIKALSEARADDEALGRRLERESRILARLAHPNIVAVHEAGELEGRAFLVMEHVDGRPLSDVIAALRARDDTPSTQALVDAIDRPAPAGRQALVELGVTGDRESDAYWVQVARILQGIARAIAAAHAAGVLHRDLKPANVMLRGGGIPVVLDFGLAASPAVGEGSVTDRLFGSVPYLAPEQVRDMRVGSDARTDIYQLGILLYEALTLRRAFDGDFVSDVLAKVREGDFPPPRSVQPSVPRELEAICLCATALDPAHRYARVEDLLIDLERFERGEAPRFARVRAMRRTRLFVRRHRRALLAGATALLLGLLVGGWWLAARGPELRYEAFAVSAEDASLRRHPASVSDAEIVGCDIETDAACFVYAVSVSGPDARNGKPRYVRALDPLHKSEVLAMLGGGEEPASRDWLELGPGAHSLCLSQIAADHIEIRDWDEGVWLFCLPERSVWLDDWIEALRARADLLPEDAVGVAFDDALAALGTKRGHGVGTVDVDADKRARLREALAAGRPREAWPFGNPKPIELWFRVEADSKKQK